MASLLENYCERDKEAVVVVLESGAGVVWRIDIDALNLPSIVGQQCLKSVEVIALDEHVS
ncbi:hypothetical protein [Halomonas sp. 72]|uniref:hypothetical protein n=1 Tax=Halomonas sp. 72 TaxID=3457738 RepID=UPI003FB870EE